MSTLKAITDYLDRELRVKDFEDASHNGLQVENSGQVTKVACGVDASLEFFREAERRGADLLVVHHGMSWGDSLRRITGLNYRRLSFLMERDLALYACHLPLDAHPRWGNNAQICRALGLRKLKPFGAYHGRMLGFEGRLAAPMRYGEFKRLCRRVFGNELRTMDFGKKTVRSVAVVSGGAAEQLNEAGEKGIDVYVSGEAKLTAYHAAQEYGINAVFAGHYATEGFGVKAVMGVLKRKFGLAGEFVDLKVPF